MPDWLSDIQPEIEHQATAPEEPAAVGDQFAWLGGADDDEAIAAEITDVTGDSLQPMAEPFDWGDTTEPSRADTMPDWLGDIQSEDAPTGEPAQAFDSGFSWIDDINAPEAGELQPEPEYVEEPAAHDEAPDMEEIVMAPTPANNAPDWLNAMVPGLDVDYAAPEDEPIEQTYAEDVVLHRSMAFAPEVSPSPRKDFDWLVEIVEEETQQMPAAQTGGRRFVFSRQPAWLRQPTEQRDEAAPRRDAQDDETDGQDDSDLPDWLR
ncbi:MAG: hypothetical protein HXY41_17950, partial [Chloroflexi bacterium]|nr:hypothetical protein [Chloroflexota bacterium]